MPCHYSAPATPPPPLSPPSDRPPPPPPNTHKSTLLDMLSGRKSLGQMTGCTTLGGKEKAVSGTDIRRLASYVAQVRQGKEGGRGFRKPG